MAARRQLNLIQIEMMGLASPSFRLAALSDAERAKLKQELLKIQASATNVKGFQIVSKPPLFDDLEALIRDIEDEVSSRTTSGRALPPV
jgi:hypothetical protein